MTPLDRLRSIVGNRTKCYRSVFNQERRDAALVLEDLAEFCRANEPTFHPDPRTHALLEGRREVWLRIQTYARLTEDDVLRLRIAALEAKKNPGQ